MHKLFRIERLRGFPTSEHSSSSRHFLLESSVTVEVGSASRPGGVRTLFRGANTQGVASAHLKTCRAASVTVTT